MKLNCQKIFSLLLSLMMLITALPMASAPAYAKSDDAIPISTPEELDTLVRANLAGNFILTQDIDLTDYLSAGGPGYNGGAGWQPINDFRGIFDGNGYTINGLYSNRPNQNFVGLFAILREAKIRNLGMVGVEVRGKDFVGGLAGVAPNPSDTIFNCYVKGQVAGNTTVGGMVGQSTGLIRQSYSSCNVSAIRFDVGGLVGSHYGQIWESYTTGNVTTPTNICAGGLVGRNYRDSSILDSYATGHVSGNSMIGGLVGSNNQGSIVSSYAKGRVQKTNPLGIIGGLVGAVSGGTTERSYWDIQTSTQEASAGGTGKSTTEMKTQSTFEDWDFNDVWAMAESHDGYPYLIWTVTPTIYSQPEDQTINAGEPASFSVRASTTAGDPVNYQWKKDNVDIPGATLAMLTIEAAAASDAAAYTVEVSNGTRTVTSQPATLTVNPGSGGPGDDPIEIWTADDLNNVRNDLDGSYILMNDIDLGETYGAAYAGGRGWQPIHEGFVEFTGIFNGNGHTISGLYINRPDELYVGLFGLVGTDAEVFNARLEDVDVTGDAYVGGLAGITLGSISKTGVSGTVSGRNYIGGLAGMTFGDISSSYAVANVTSLAIGGGLVGSSTNTATIENTYALGAVTANQAGGLVGVNGGVLQRSYAAGRVTGTGLYGGLVGLMAFPEDIISDCYWDIEATNQPEAGVEVSSDAASGYPTEQMMQQETFTGWDFDTIWAIDTEPSSYPYFLWQPISDPGTDPVAPSISDQPQNQTVTIGQTATFTVTAAGSEPLNYQWKKEGIDIAGATSATLEIVNAQTSDAGTYTVEVSNDAGTILSDSATLT
ncbi:immunoglobulin domain-containing protein, partial [Desulforamulus aeronauticus]